MENYEKLLEHLTFNEFMEANDVYAELVQLENVDQARALGALFRHAYRRGKDDERARVAKRYEERQKRLAAQKTLEDIQAEYPINGGIADE